MGDHAGLVGEDSPFRQRLENGDGNRLEEDLLSRESGQPVAELTAADPGSDGDSAEEGAGPGSTEPRSEIGPEETPLEAGPEAIGAEGAPAEPQGAKGTSNLRPLLIEILQTVLLTLIIFAAVRSVVQNFKVDGASMEPTLHSGQYLLINKLAYLRVEGAPLEFAQKAGLARNGGGALYPFGGPQRGDVIVFLFPGRPDRDFIKRVIGLPGDTVMVDRGRVYVNGVLLQEEYIRAVPSYSLPAQKVPEGNYFVLGDNRPNSSDSHIWGFVPEANLIGKAWVSYWPPNQWGLVANSGMAGN